ncbi:MAG: polyprenyl synthetase family protein, partial [Oscillospiraceae bacterium]
MKSDFSDTLEISRQLVEEKLKDIIKSRKNNLNEAVMNAMEYSVLNGGKRLRAFLTIETCKMFGGRQEAAVLAAAAIEMTHAYSLI